MKREKKKKKKAYTKLSLLNYFHESKVKNEWAIAHNLLCKSCFVIEIVEKTDRVDYFTDQQKKKKSRKKEQSTKRNKKK